MLGIASKSISKEQRVLHKSWCIYTKRINKENRMAIDFVEGRDNYKCACKYCGGLRGVARDPQEILKRLEKEHQVQLICDKKTDTLYVRTEMGFWKIFVSRGTGKYVLFHRNKFNPTMSTEAATWGDYHRQRDVSQTEDLDLIVKYIAEHDKAKKIISIDYHMLPKRTKQQKQYYRSYESKMRKNKKRRLYSLFDEIEKNNEELRKVSIW